MPLISALRRQRQADPCEFEASLVYRMSSKMGSKATQRNPVSGWRDGSEVNSTATPPEVLSSIPSNHMVTHNHL